jgi:hypothetical protein
MGTTAKAPTGEDLIGIQQALYAYCGGIDTKDYDLFRAAFTDDVRASYGELFGPFDGLDQLATFMEVLHRDLDNSAHRVSNIYFLEFDGDSARVRSYVNAILVKVGHPGGDFLHAHGTYVNELRRGPDGWRIGSKQYEHLLQTGNPNIPAFDEAIEAVARLSAG